MYNRHYIYVVFFGDYSPDCHFSVCQSKFYYLNYAREFAKKYSDAYIFKVHFSDSGDILSFDEIF